MVLQPQLGGMGAVGSVVGFSDIDEGVELRFEVARVGGIVLRSQCFLVNTGTSINAQ